MVQVGKEKVGVPEGGERDIGNDLVPLEANLQQTFEGSWGLEIFYQSEDMLYALFKVEVAPAHSSKPWRCKDNGLGHFSVEATISERFINSMQLDLFALLFQGGGGV